LTCVGKMCIQLGVPWDEAKRFATLVERGLDFADAFDGRPALHVPARLGMRRAG